MNGWGTWVSSGNLFFISVPGAEELAPTHPSDSRAHRDGSETLGGIRESNHWGEISHLE